MRPASRQRFIDQSNLVIAEVEGFSGNWISVGARDPAARRGHALETGTPSWAWKACALSGGH